MSQVRSGRRTYYNLFAQVYDAFVNFHARREAGDTRSFLVDMAWFFRKKVNPCVLDVCCGTGGVIIAFATRHPGSFAVGYDFSRGMLSRVRDKQGSQQIALVEGDAASLPFVDGCFDVVTCSHALYELKTLAREAALQEMKRVVHADGLVLLMEHEVPDHPMVKLLFHLRMLTMGSADTREFVTGGLEPYRRIFPDVSLFHTRARTSKLMVCRKHDRDTKEDQKETSHGKEEHRGLSA